MIRKIKRTQQIQLSVAALAAGQKVNDVIQPVGQIGIDPNLYEVRTILTILVSCGRANDFGEVAKATTETSIAEARECLAWC